MWSSKASCKQCPGHVSMRAEVHWELDEKVGEGLLRDFRPQSRLVPRLSSIPMTHITMRDLSPISCPLTSTLA